MSISDTKASIDTNLAILGFVKTMQEVLKNPNIGQLLEQADKANIAIKSNREALAQLDAERAAFRNEMVTQKALLNGQEDELDRKEKKLSDKEADLNFRDSELKKSEQDMAIRRKAITAKEKELSDKEILLNAKADNLTAREASNKDREAALNSRESILNERDQNIRALIK